MRDLMVALPLIATALLLIINNTQCTRRDERTATAKSSPAPDQDQPEPGEQDSAMVQQLVEHSPMHTAILRFIRASLQVHLVECQVRASVQASSIEDTELAVSAQMRRLAVHGQ